MQTADYISHDLGEPGNNYTRRGVFVFVTFRQLFPAANWCLRRLASRLALRIYGCLLAIIFIPAVALRIEAAVFERRAEAIVHALSPLRVGVSSKAEAIASVPAPKPDSRPCGPNGTDECLSIGIPNSRLSDAVFGPVVRTENSALYSLLTWWGFRYWSLSVDMRFTSGRVSFLSYHLMLSDSHFNGGVDAIIVRVTSQERILGRNQGLTPAGDQAYRLTPSGAWPDKGVGIALTPGTPAELVNHAFDLKLDCLWSLDGCSAWRQLLPQVRG